MAKHFLERYCFCCLHNCNCLWLSLWMFKFAMHSHTCYGTAPALLFLKKFQMISDQYVLVAKKTKDFWGAW